jgi:hypothetical protein
VECYADRAEDSLFSSADSSLYFCNRYKTNKVPLTGVSAVLAMCEGKVDESEVTWHKCVELLSIRD